jgi:hypothetical protein
MATASLIQVRDKSARRQLQSTVILTVNPEQIGESFCDSNACARDLQT